MSAKQMHPVSLNNAQRRIEDLRSELEWTVSSVEQLTRIGRDDLALRLVNEQRSSLSAFVDLVTQDVASVRPRLGIRRRAALTVTAAAIAVLTFASLGIAHSTRTPLQAAAARFARAEAISDPAARLRALIGVYERTETIAGARTLNAKVADVARRTQDELRGDHSQDNDDLMALADRTLHDSTQPPGAPSTGATPVDNIKRSVTGK